MNFIKQFIALSYHDEDERIVPFARIDINYKITRNLKTVRSKGSFIHSGNNMYDSFISLYDTREILGRTNSSTLYLEHATERINFFTINDMLLYCS